MCHGTLEPTGFCFQCSVCPLDPAAILCSQGPSCILEFPVDTGGTCSTHIFSLSGPFLGTPLSCPPQEEPTRNTLNIWVLGLCVCASLRLG